MSEVKEMLYLLNEDLKAIAPLESYRSLFWERRFDRAGEVRISADGKFFALAHGARYLFRAEHGDLALLQAVIREKDGSLTLKGREAAALLAQRVLSRPLPAGGGLLPALKTEIGKLCEAGERKIPGFAVGEFPENEAQFDGAEAGEDLLSFCLSRLNPIGMGLSITAEGEAVVCGVRAGRDLSGQVVFSDTFENLLGLQYGEDSEDCFNVAYVAGEDAEGGELLLTVERQKDGQARRECFVDARSVRRRYKNEAGETVERSEEEYRAILTRRGEQALGGKEILRAEVSAGGAWRYRKEYEIGDLVAIEDKTVGVSEVLRVIGATERISEGKSELSLLLDRAT